MVSGEICYIIIYNKVYVGSFSFSRISVVYY